MAASTDLIVVISIDTYCIKLAASSELALSHWSEKNDLIPTQGTAACCDNCWDTLIAAALAASLLDSIPWLSKTFGYISQLKCQVLGFLLFQLLYLA